MNAKKPWLAIFGLALGCIASALISWKLFELVAQQATVIRALQEANDHQRGLLAKLEPLTKKAVWTNEKQVLNTCTTNRDTVTCTFTNKEDFPVTTCVKGLIYQKEATGVRLNGLPMCTGRLLPLETKVVTSPWVAGFADDICYRENSYGKHLDWSKCVFTTEAYDLSDSSK